MSDLATFATECEENLVRMESGLLNLEHDSADPGAVDAVFRAAHNIKGSAKIVGLNEVGELAHVLEEALQRVRDGRLRINPTFVSFCLKGIDSLREELHRSVDSDESGIDLASAGARTRVAESADELGASSGSGRTLRVDLDRLDGVVKLLGEIVISRGSMEALLTRADSPTWQPVLESHRKAERLYSDMRDLVMQLRMVPMGPVLGSYRRTVRDVSAVACKKARLVVTGGDVEIDANLIESLKDPLNHMVRNAVDHGLEPSEERAALGKDPCGTVTLAARREGGAIAIMVADDGAGLNRDRILARARERGLIGSEDTLTDEEIYCLVFQPGFSTAEVITDISGRGVGMDVVRQNIEALRGSVSIESRSGLGTTMTLRLPMSLAIINGFHVGIGDDTFVFPLEQVVECLAADDVMRDIGAGDTLVDFRGKLIRCLKPLDMFSMGVSPSSRQCAVVVDHGGELVAVMVDHLLGESQTVVKPLGPMFEGLTLFSGSTITGSGDVALILDVPSLVQGQGLPGGEAAQRSHA